ncbi:Spy/CpxP family protein refolding chaperone [Fluviispira vulneris]|uniref:Spy/CpxP family protein refolding chaperone n=1 Tax=Fluviispira vulneris TaxID=2763012 RepID=UPI001647C6E1|nr:Spy/CpxP family protein refolding chaperone [Fluviispira vulneris]
MKKNFLVASQLICILFSSPFTYAQPSNYNHEEAHDYTLMRHEKFLEDPILSLTQEQKDKLKKIFSESKAEMKKAGNEVWEKRKVLRDAIIDEKKSEKDLYQIHDDLDKLQKYSSSLHFKLMLKIRSVITSEQRKNFFKKMESRRKNHHSDKDKL